MDLTIENKLIADRYRGVIGRTSFGDDLNLPEKILSSGNGTLIISIPYWVAGAFPSHIDLNELRSLSLGNLLGAAYILMQDRIMDGQNISDHMIPEWLLVSNTIYYRWLKEYQRVFRSDDYFWALFEKYMNDFVGSSLWEKREHFGKVRKYEAGDIAKLGQKFALVNMSVAGVCLLAEAEETIPAFADLIHNYHIAYQMFDDASDWQEDLAAGNYTYFLVKALDHIGREPTQQKIEECLRTGDITVQHIGESSEYYRKAARRAEELNCAGLLSFIHDKILQNEQFLARTCRGPHERQQRKLSSVVNMGSGTEVKLSPAHVFQRGGRHFLYHVDRNVALSIDESMYEFVRVLQVEGGMISNDPAGYTSDTGEVERRKLIDELAEVGLVSGAQAKVSNGVITTGRKRRNFEVVTSLGVIVTNAADCSAVIPFETAARSIDMLFTMSGYETDLFIHLFIGSDINESITEILGRIYEYAVTVSKKLYKRLNVSLNIDIRSSSEDAAAEQIRVQEEVNVIIERCRLRDGDRFVVHLIKPQTPDIVSLQETAFSPGTYKSGIARICRRIFPGDELASPSVADIDGVLWSDIRRGLEFRIRQHKKHNYFCNAGKSYVAISVDGNFYPCHHFAMAGINPIGRTLDAIRRTQSTYIERNGRSRTECSECWLLNICGGGCLLSNRSEDGEHSRSDAMFCDRYRSLAEDAMSSRFAAAESEQPHTPDEADIRPCEFL